MRSELLKIIVYNYLFEFSGLELELKNKFKNELINEASNDVQNKFLFLHLPAEISCKFTEDISGEVFRLNKHKLHYRNDISKINLKWNLKKCLEFSEKNKLLDYILNVEIPHFQKRETLPMYDMLKTSIQLRNSLAHETCNIKEPKSLESLSDEKLLQLIEKDPNFSDYAGLNELDSKYKSVLAHYFYLLEIKKIIQNGKE